MAEDVEKAPEQPGANTRRSLVSIVSPAYNESVNIPLMYEQLAEVLADLDVEWEWIVVDDHSVDETFDILTDISHGDPRVKAIRLARRSGSHTALACGLQFAQGDSCIVMAADLQDPPSTIPTLLETWRGGFHVVWAVRARREGESQFTIQMSKLYYWLMRNFVGMKEIPSTGADFMLLDRRVVDAFNEFHESTISVLALITWLGFRQTAIPYDKAARVHGRSGWNLRSKLKLVVDSITSFTYLPIRLMSYVGILFAFLGFLYASFIVVMAMNGSPIPGWSSLMVIVLVIGGVQMTMIGVLGIYVWRALDEARRRPKFIVEATTLSSSIPESSE